MSPVWRLASGLYALTLRAFPEHHRAQYRDEMLDGFTLETAGRAERHGAWSALRFAIAACINAIVAGFASAAETAGEAGRTNEASDRERWDVT